MLDNSNEEKIYTEEIKKDDFSGGFDNESAGKMPRPERKFKASTFVRKHTSEHLRIISIASTPSKDRTSTEKDTLCDFILSKLKRSIQAFENLDRSAVSKLAVSCRLIRLESGESVYCAGDEVDAVYLPISGSVEEHMEGIGRVAAIKPNVGFGFTGVDKSTSCTRQHSVVARDACCLIAVPKYAYQHLVIKIRNEKRKRELAFLLSIPVFSQLARSALVRFIPLFERCEFKQGMEIVVGSNMERAAPVRQRRTTKLPEQCPYIYFISQGKCIVVADVAAPKPKPKSQRERRVVVVSKNKEPKLQSLSKLHELQYFGDIAVLLGKPEPATIRVSSLKAILWRIHKVDVPKLGGTVLQMMRNNAKAKLNWRAGEIQRIQQVNRCKWKREQQQNKKTIRSILAGSSKSSKGKAVARTPISHRRQHPIEYLEQFKQLRINFLDKKKKEAASLERFPINSGSSGIQPSRKHRISRSRSSNRLQSSSTTGLKDSRVFYSPTKPEAKTKPRSRPSTAGNRRSVRPTSAKGYHARPLPIYDQNEMRPRGSFSSFH